MENAEGALHDNRAMTDNKADKNRALEIAFLVDAELLGRLAVVLSEVGKPIEYKVKFSDHTSVEYPDVEEIIHQPNTRQRSVVSVTANTPGERQESAYVVLRASPSPHVEYTVKGSQARVIYFGSQLDDWVAAIRQWYSPLYDYAFLVVIFALYTRFFLWQHVGSHFLPVAIEQGKTDSWIRFLAILVMEIAGFSAFKLFPRATFAVGQGTKRDEFLKYLRNTIVGFALAVLAGMLVSLLKL